MKAQDLFHAFKEAQISFFCGVPDSVLKEFCAYLEDNAESLGCAHEITANEGSAVSMAAGFYLSSGQVPLVYMQNSGLGNAVNPLASLCHGDVYQIPMLLFIGWRGEIENGQQIKDEPQHLVKGRMTEALLNLLGIPVFVLDQNEAKNPFHLVSQAVTEAKKRSAPVAILCRKGLFEKSAKPKSQVIDREKVIAEILNLTPVDVPVFATTGMAGREAYEVKKKSTKPMPALFMNVGAMGHISQIAAGFLRGLNESLKPHKKVLCLDGDGSLLMHLGGLGAAARSPGLVHVLLNNGAHDSVGGQKTIGFEMQWSGLAKAMGYESFASFDFKTQAKEWPLALRQRLEAKVETKVETKVEAKAQGACLFEIRFEAGHREDLLRPSETLAELKQIFMREAR